MAHVFVDPAHLGPAQRAVLPSLQRLSDRYWVLGEARLWRTVDWLILRDGSTPQIFVVTQIETQRPIRGFQNSAWECQDTDGWWRPLAMEIPEDVNPLGQAVNTAEMATAWLREHGQLDDTGRCWPVLLVLPGPKATAQIPEMPIDGKGQVVLGVGALREALETFGPPPGEQPAIAAGAAHYLSTIVAPKSGLRPATVPTALAGITLGTWRRWWPAVAGVALLALALSLAIRGNSRGAEFPPEVLGAMPAPLVDAVAALSGRQPAAPYCSPGQSPVYVLGFAELNGALGDTMGQPTECEHTDPASGDVQQRTTTGLAYYRPSLNLPMFTTGAEHWALTPRGVVYWVGESVTPPPEARLL